MSLRLYSCFRDTAGKIKLNDTYIATTCHDWHLVSWSGNDAMSIGSAARLVIHLLSTHMIMTSYAQRGNGTGDYSLVCALLRAQVN